MDGPVHIHMNVDRVYVCVCVINKLYIRMCVCVQGCNTIERC